MKLIKVFDCQEMPDDVREAFFCEKEASNDCYVDWCLDDLPEDLNSEEDPCYGPDYLKVSKWLLENGASIDDKDIIIKHWW